MVYVVYNNTYILLKREEKDICERKDVYPVIIHEKTLPQENVYPLSYSLGRKCTTTREKPCYKNHRKSELPLKKFKGKLTRCRTISIYHPSLFCVKRNQ